MDEGRDVVPHPLHFVPAWVAGRVGHGRLFRRAL
jgi:hypothetical protein